MLENWTMLTLFEKPVILHLDVDSFEIQVRQRRLGQDTDLSRPIVAINAKGQVLSATKSAKDLGIKRLLMLNLETVGAIYPSLEVLIVENDEWDKPESKSKREAGLELRECVRKFFEQKSIMDLKIYINSLDDMFIDITFVIGPMLYQKVFKDVPYELPDQLPDNVFFEDTARYHAQNVFKECLKRPARGSVNKNAHLMLGGITAQELSEYILLKTGFRVSIGVSCNKSMAKVATSLNRPQGISILTMVGFQRVSKYVSATKIPGLGREKGAEIFQSHGRTDMTIAEFKEIPLQILSQHMHHSLASMIMGRAAGLDDEPVEDKHMSKGLSVSKRPDRNNNTIEHIRGKIEDLCHEMIERLQEEMECHRRIGTHFRIEAELWNHTFRSCVSGSFEIDRWDLKDTSSDDMADMAVQALQENGFQLGSFFVQKFKLTVTQFSSQLPKRCLKQFFMKTDSDSPILPRVEAGLELLPQTHPVSTSCAPQPEPQPASPLPSVVPLHIDSPPVQIPQPILFVRVLSPLQSVPQQKSNCCSNCCIS